MQFLYSFIDDVLWILLVDLDVLKTQFYNVTV